MTHQFLTAIPVCQISVHFGFLQLTSHLEPGIKHILHALMGGDLYFESFFSTKGQEKFKKPEGVGAQVKMVEVVCFLGSGSFDSFCDFEELEGGEKTRKNLLEIVPLCYFEKGFLTLTVNE